MFFAMENMGYFEMKKQNVSTIILYSEDARASYSACVCAYIYIYHPTFYIRKFKSIFKGLITGFDICDIFVPGRFVAGIFCCIALIGN